MKPIASITLASVAVLLGGGLYTPRTPAAGLVENAIDAEQGRRDARVQVRQQRREDRQDAREARRDCLGKGPECHLEVHQQRFDAGKERLQERMD